MGRVPDDRSLFSLLGVDDRATWEEVRAAFRDAIRSSHPDVRPEDPDAERRTALINAAWETVNTPGRWAEFVAGGGDARSSPSGRPAPAVTRLRILRQRRGGTGLRRWGIELDETLVATVANGEAAVVDVAPGRHRVRVFYETYASPTLQVALRAGEEVVLGCRQLPGLRVNLLTPKRALVLERLDGRGFPAG